MLVDEWNSDILKGLKEKKGSEIYEKSFYEFCMRTGYLDAFINDDELELSEILEDLEDISDEEISEMRHLLINGDKYINDIGK